MLRGGCAQRQRVCDAIIWPMKPLLPMRLVMRLCAACVLFFCGGAVYANNGLNLIGYNAGTTNKHDNRVHAVISVRY